MSFWLVQYFVKYFGIKKSNTIYRNHIFIIPDKLPWSELLDSRRKLWTPYDFQIDKGQALNIGLTFKEVIKIKLLVFYGQCFLFLNTLLSSRQGIYKSIWVSLFFLLQNYKNVLIIGLLLRNWSTFFSLMVNTDSTFILC